MKRTEPARRVGEGGGGGGAGAAGAAGLTLIEFVVALAVAAVVVPAVAVGLENTLTRIETVENRTLAVELARSLMEEILSREFADPDDCYASGFGPEEAARADFDDVDDYDGLADSPPRDASGTAIPWASAFTRNAVVASVSPTALDVPVADGTTFLKKITVTVQGPSETIQLHALKGLLNVRLTHGRAAIAVPPWLVQPHLDHGDSLAP